MGADSGGGREAATPVPSPLPLPQAAPTCSLAGTKDMPCCHLPSLNALDSATHGRNPGAAHARELARGRVIVLQFYW